MKYDQGRHCSLPTAKAYVLIDAMTYLNLRCVLLCDLLNLLFRAVESTLGVLHLLLHICQIDFRL